MRRLIPLILIAAQACALLPIGSEPEIDHFGQPQAPVDWDEIGAQLSSQRAEQEELQRELAWQRQQRINSAFAERDITLGMTLEQVNRIWGEPHEVGYAGQPGTGNERWVYSNGLTSPRHGVVGGRIIYFENGQVAGWESLD